MTAITVQTAFADATVYAVNFKGKSYLVRVRHQPDKDNKPIMRILPETKHYNTWRNIRNQVWQHHLQYG